MKTRLLLIPAFVVLVGSTLWATDRIDAMGFAGDEDTLISKLAERFGTSEEEVQVVFDEHRQQRRLEMENQFADRLNADVTAGTLTEEQKQLILAKHEELQTMRQDMWQELEELSPEDRRATMQAQHDEMETWAKENGIDFAELQLGFGSMHEGRGMHRGEGMGMRYESQLDQE